MFSYKKIKENKILLLILVSFVATFTGSIFYSIGSQPENSVFNIFLLKSPTMNNFFGKITKVEHHFIGSSVQYTTTHKETIIEGKIRYEIFGVRKTGFVFVYWERNNSNKISCIKKIVFLNNSQQEYIIPFKENEERCVKIIN
jgi:hypothetical protein